MHGNTKKRLQRRARKRHRHQLNTYRGTHKKYYPKAKDDTNKQIPR